MIDAKELLAFEEEIAQEFQAGNIKAPVHLAGGNERALIDIFDDIGADDWKLCSWRSHYHALLAGVPRDEVKAAILSGRSIAMCFPAYRVLSSAIVGGICPIALGLAWGIEHRGGRDKVHVFLGDMAAETGIFHECAKYAAGHSLPVIWHIEDNEKSVCTDTRAVWGREHAIAPAYRYHYQLTRPHVGTGRFVRF